MSAVLATAVLPFASLYQARVVPSLLPEAVRVTVAGPQLETGVVASWSLLRLTVATAVATSERQPCALKART